MPQQMTQVNERFSRLEDRIYRVGAIFDDLRARNQELKEEVEALRLRCLEMEERYERLRSSIDGMCEDRDQVVQRIRTVLATMDGLEDRK